MPSRPTSYAVTIFNQDGSISSYGEFNFAKKTIYIISSAQFVKFTGLPAFTNLQGAWKFTDECRKCPENFVATLLDFANIAVPLPGGDITAATEKTAITGTFSDCYTKISGTYTFATYNNPSDALANINALAPGPQSFTFTGVIIEPKGTL